MKTFQLDDVKISDKAIETLVKYKNVLESLGIILMNPDPDDIIEKIIEEDIAMEDQELITSFIEVGAAMNRFVNTANKE